MTSETTTRNGGSVDPITMSVVFHRLGTINEEMGITMMRTSRSPIFAEVADLTLTYNRARQETITKEMLDIVGGAEALAKTRA